MEKSLLSVVKRRNPSHFGHIVRNAGGCPEKEVVQDTAAGSCDLADQ